MSNRRERRARSKQADKGRNDVPLSQTSRDIPTGRTLLDIANERQLLSTTSQSNPSITTTQICLDGSLSELEAVEGSTEPLATPYLDIVLYTISLTLLHYTLTVLVHHQYGNSAPSLRKLWYDSTVASPAPILILILVAVLHPRSPQMVTQLLFAVLSLMAGVWLVHASNEDPYMAVMKKAPPLGTLWVWAVVEMRWEWAVGSLSVVASWGWWKGYTVY